MVSIIIPTYKNAHLMEIALVSSLSQNVQKEIIVVDDASPDPYPEHIKAYFDRCPEIRFIRHFKNRGLAATRNTGIVNAKYDFILPLDADDELNVYALPKMCSAMVDADIVYGDMLQGEWMCYPSDLKLSVEMFRATNPIFGTSLYRKSIWERVGGYTERPFSHYEDWNFWAKCFKAGAKFVRIDQVIYKHVIHPDSMTKSLESRDKYLRKLALEGVFE